MEMMTQPTVRPGMLRGDPTLPAGAWQSGKHGDGVSLPVGTVIDHWKVVSRMLSSENSTLYFARSGEEKVDTLIKIHHAGTESGLWRRLMMLQDACLMPLLSCGTWQDHPFEVMPFYAEGTLEGGVLPEKVLLQVVIPQLDQALSVLHRAHLLHNDVKPANLFWKERDTSLVLGDYDCVSSDASQQEVGGTPAYMAPETLISHGKIHTPASDYCSMGLTLLTLLTGENPLVGKSEREQMRIWQRGIRCPENVPPRLGVLIQGMLRYEPGKRLGHEEIQRWLKYDGSGGSIRTRRPRAQPEKKQLLPLHFKDRILLEPQELFDAAAQDWAYATFLLRQRQMHRFLIQFDQKYFALCESCAKTFDCDEGLFRLLQTVCPGKRFCWCGQIYSGLEEFAEKAASRSPLKRDDPAVHFLRLGLLSFYLSCQGATPEQIQFADSLHKLVMEDPDLAVTQLLVSMSHHPELSWYGNNFYSLHELADWLLTQKDLDHVVEELYHARRFEAWLDFIRCGRFIPEVQTIMREMGT